jgi:hypothetical protein
MEQERKEIIFYHGALCESYEKQANRQGYTLGDKAEMFENIAFAYNMLRIHGYFTDKMEDSICRKIQKNLVKAVKPIKENKVAVSDGTKSEELK